MKNSRLSRNVYTMSDRIYDVTNISGTHPRKNVKTMGKVFDMGIAKPFILGVGVRVGAGLVTPSPRVWLSLLQ